MAGVRVAGQSGPLGQIKRTYALRLVTPLLGVYLETLQCRGRRLTGQHSLRPCVCAGKLEAIWCMYTPGGWAGKWGMPAMESVLCRLAAHRATQIDPKLCA